MPSIIVYDNVPHSHCGCDTDHNPEVTTFTFEASTVRAAGADITRHNFDEEPMAFMSTPISSFVAKKGIHRLPAVVVDGAVVLDGRYPTREELAEWAGLTANQLATLVEIPEETLPLAGHGSGGSCGCGTHGHGGCGCGGHGHGHEHSGHGEHHGQGGGCGCGGQSHKHGNGHGHGGCGCGGHGHAH